MRVIERLLAFGYLNIDEAHPFIFQLDDMARLFIGRNDALAVGRDSAIASEARQ